MGDKDLPINRLFDGQKHILTFYDTADGLPICDNIIADSLTIGDEYESDETGVPCFGSFACNVSGLDMKDIMGWIDKDTLNHVTIVVEGKPYINRPKNLKYPNRRRKMRIWKKWAKRFGTRPAPLVTIPSCTFKVNFE